MTEKTPKNLATATPDSGEQAREQATAYESTFADSVIVLNNGDTVSVPPHPDLGMLSDAAMEEYEELQFEMESYDHEDDIKIPEQRLLDESGKETGVVIPATVQKGAVKRPFRKDGQLIKPPHSVKVAQIALGAENYKRLVDGGKSAADVWRIWGTQANEIRKRQNLDSKSDGSSLALEAVSSSDS